MANVLLTGNGSWPVRLGYGMGGFLDQLALEGGTATARVLSGALWTTRYSTLVTQYNSGVTAPSTLDGFFASMSAWQGAQNGFGSAIQTLIQNTTIKMADQSQALPSKDLKTALQLIIAQMVGTADSFNASAPSLGNQTNVNTPIGDPIVVGSVKNANDGVVFQYLFPETLSFLTTADAVTGGATAGQETISFKGQAAASNNFAYNWPLGSSSSGSLTCVDGTLSNSGGNLLTNSDFKVFSTSNYPDNFFNLVGVAGTTIFNGGSANAYTTNGGSLQFTGDGGGTLIAVYQPFNTASSTTAGAGGTPAKLTAFMPLHLNVWVKTSATPAAGVLEFSLTDGSGTTINDQAGNANLFTKSLTAVSTSFVNVNGAFRLPANPPAVIRLKVRLSTSIDNTKSVYLGRMSLTKPTQIYTGGPYFSAHSGSTATLANDAWTLPVSQTYGTFQREFERYFGMRGLGLVMPSSGSPTIADSLVA